MRNVWLCSLLLMSLAALAATDDTQFTPGGLPLTRQLTDFPIPATPLQSATDVTGWLQANKAAFGMSAQSDIKVAASVPAQNGYTLYRLQQTVNDIAVYAHQSVLVLQNGLPVSAHLVSSSLPAQAAVNPQQLEQAVKQGLAAAQIDYQGELTIVPVYWRSEQQLLAAAQVDGRFSKQQVDYPYRLIISAAGVVVKALALQHDFRYELIDVDQMCSRLSYRRPTTADDLLQMTINGYASRYKLPSSAAQATTSAEKALAELFDYTNRFMQQQLDIAGIDSADSVLVAAYVGDNFYEDSLSCVGNNTTNAFWHTLNDRLGLIQIHAPLLQNPEVIMHELGHGIVSFSSELVYEGQAGALNEAYGDAVGVSFSAWRNNRMDTPSAEDWSLRLGRKAIRDFSFPTKIKDMPDHYSERYTGSKDHGGVHINSSIINHAFYLLAEGGEHRRLGGIAVPALGMSKTLKIWHYGTTNILTPTSDFRDARYAFAEAAEIIYGKYSDERTAVHQAFDAVGVKGSWSVNVPPKPAPDPLPEKTPLPDPQPEPQPKPQPQIPAEPVPSPSSPVPDSTTTTSLLSIVLLALALFAGLIVIVRRSRPAQQTVPAYRAYQYAEKAEVSTPVAAPQTPKAASNKPMAYFHAAGKVYPLLTEALMGRGVTIGRSADATISLSHASVSSFHLRLYLQDQVLYAEDVGSSYGSRVGGAALPKHQPVKLELEQSLQLADLVCRISASAASADAGNIAKQQSVLTLHTTLHDVTLRSGKVGQQGVSIGRDPGNDLVFAHSAISKIHGRIRYVNQGWWYQDLESKYGSGLMQGGVLQKVAPGAEVALTAGAELYLADFKIVITIDPANQAVVL